MQIDRAPAPGEPSTKADSSKEQYLSKAKWFRERASRDLSDAHPSPVVVAAHAINLRSEWAKSTWRVIKNSLIYAFEVEATAEASQAIDLLRAHTQSECLKTSTRTSGRRAKTYSDADLTEVRTAIQRSRSEFASILVTWVLLGNIVGLRPHEWGKSHLVWATPGEVGDLDLRGDNAVQPYLRIENAKATNGRSHGQYRHLNLRDMSPDHVRAVDRFAQLMYSIVAAGEYNRIYEGCSKLLERVNREIHRDDSERWIQLYSPRHRFTSAAKGRYSQAQTAALLGHGTDRTASQHYGRRSAAVGGIGPLPVEQEVNRVRATRAYQARAAADAGMAPTVPPTGKPRG